jgi:hypothetical protein
MLDLTESASISKSIEDQQKKIKEEAEAEKERKAKEKEAEITKRRDSRNQAREEKRLQKLKAEEERQRKAEEREAKRKQRDAEIAENDQSKRQQLLDSSTSAAHDNVAPQLIHNNNHPVQTISPVQQVLDGANNVSAADICLIDEFLQGKYRIMQFNVVKHDEEKVITLNERVFVDSNGDRKRESLTIILDYAYCKWRKVKRTTKDKT